MTTQTNKANKIRKSQAPTPQYNLVDPDFNGPHAHCTLNGIFGGPTWLIGGGKKDYAFSSLQQVVDSSMEVVDSGTWKLPEVRVTKGDSFEIDLGVLKHFDAKMEAPVKMVRFIKAKPPTKRVSTERLLAHDLMNVMIADMFAQPVHEFFERDLETLVENKHLLAPEYHEIADSLRDQLLPAQKQVIDALPLVMTKLRDRYPDASTGQLFQGALQLIGQQLSPILSTVQMWTTGFRQSLNPALKDKLRIVRAIITSNLFLALTGNLRLDKWRNREDIKQLIKTINVSVGDVVLPVLIGAFDSGPAVIPMTGEVGPRGGHIAFVPWNLLKFLPGIIPIYAHETGHLIQRVIIKYLETYSKLTVDTITKAIDGGLELDEPNIPFNGSTIPARVFWPKAVVSQFTEADADNWGIRASGPAAFIKSFVFYLGSMGGVSKGDMDKVDAFFRSSSSWTPKPTGVPGQSTASMEPHPQDNIRVGALEAEIALQMGFPDDAAYATRIGLEESETPTPTHISWFGVMPRGNGQDDDSLTDTKVAGKKKKAPAKKKTGKPQADEAPTDGKPKAPPQPKQPQLPTFKASIADYRKLIKLVVAAWLDTPTDCLNGMTLRELVNMTPEMHEKVLDVRKKLAAGDGKPSEDYYTWHLTVGAAFVEEYYAQVDAGGDPAEVRERLMKPAMEMLAQITDWWEAEVERLDIYGLKPADVQPTKVVKAKAKTTRTTKPKATKPTAKSTKKS